MGIRPVIHDRDGEDAGNPSGGTSEKRIQELVSDVERAISPQHRLYYARLAYAETTDLSSKKQVLSEIRNAFGVKTAHPAPTQLEASDSTAELILETAISPEDIAEALDQDIVDTVTMHELDPSEFDIPVAKQPTDGIFNSSAEFTELQQKWGTTDPEDSSDEESGVGNPEEVAFSDDELSFSELMDLAEAETAPSDTSTWSSDGQQGTASLIQVLVRELESDRADADDLATLRDHLGRPERRTSTQVQLEHIHSQVQTFGAYLDALEEFLDEEGTAQQLLDDLQTAIDSLQQDVQTAADERVAIRSQLDQLTGQTISEAEFNSEIDRLEQSIETLDETFEARLDQVESRVASTEERLDDYGEWRDNLQRAFASVEQSLDDDDEGEIVGSGKSS